MHGRGGLQTSRGLQRGGRRWAIAAIALSGVRVELACRCSKTRDGPADWAHSGTRHLTVGVLPAPSCKRLLQTVCRGLASTRMSTKLQPLQLAKVAGQNNWQMNLNVYYRETMEDVAKLLD